MSKWKRRIVASLLPVAASIAVAACSAKPDASNEAKADTAGAAQGGTGKAAQTSASPSHGAADAQQAPAANGAAKSAHNVEAEMAHGGAASGHSAEAGHGHEGGHGHTNAPTTTISVTPNEVKQGEAQEMRLSITDKAGKKLTFADLQEAHTKKIHLLIVDPSLTDYQHIHPDGEDTATDFTFAFTPTKAGDYKVFADLLPTATMAQEYSSTTISVPGTPDAVEETKNMESTVDGYKFSITLEKPELVVGEANLMTLTITGPDGKPFAGLEPLMGAYAHVVGFDKNRENVAHVHPMGEEPTSADQRGGPSLEFHLNFAVPGYQKLFAQVQINGKDVYAPFGFDVLPGADPAHAHGHTAVTVIPNTSQEVLGAIDQQMGKLDEVIAGNRLAEVHPLAFAVRDLVAALPEKLTGLPADQATALQTAVGRVRQQAELLDKYGDAGNAAQTKAVLTKFKTEIGGIKELVGPHASSAQAETSGDIKLAGNTICPISGSPAGSMEKDAHIIHAGYRVELCCSGCEGKFKKDADANLKKALAQK